MFHAAGFGEALRTTQENLDSRNFYAFNPSFDKKCNPADITPVGPAQVPTYGCAPGAPVYGEIPAPACGCAPANPMPAYMPQQAPACGPCARRNNRSGCSCG